MYTINYHLNKLKPTYLVIFITLSARLIVFTISSFHANSFTQFLQNLTRWDTYWYLAIAKNWYVSDGKDALAIAFYPGYPIFIKLINYLVSSLTLSSVIVATFFSFVASYFLYRLALLDFDQQTALKAVWFLNIFPTSYFLQAGYTESTFLALTIIAVYFYRKQNLVLSSILGLFSTLTRANGIILIPLFFMEMKSKKQLIPLLLTPLGLIFYLLINYFTFGDPFYFSKVLESNWFKHFGPPWEGIKSLIDSTGSFTNPNFYTSISELLTVIIIMVISVHTFFYIRRSYALYLFLNLLMMTSTTFILSSPRYALTLFPLYFSLAKTPGKISFIIISLISLTLLYYFTSLFVLGGWAF